MAPRTVYANLTDGLQPFSLWDASLADMGSLGVIPCTASGTNAITLTPVTASFPPNVSNPPRQNQLFSYVAAATSTGSVTVSISGVTGFLKLYLMDASTQAGSGDVKQNVTYIISYGPALNSAAGGFQIQSPNSDILSPVINGATIINSTYEGLHITTTTGTLTIAAAKTVTFNNSLGFSGTDGTTMTLPSTSATLARTDTGQTFTGTNAFGALTVTTLNGNTFTAGSYTLTGGASKTLTFNNTLTLAGTDSTTMTFPTTSASIARTDGGQTFTGTQNFASLTASSAVATDGSKNLISVTNTGSGNNVLATSPTLVTPTLGAATATSVAFSPTTGGIVGTTTNDNAGSGFVGEYTESVVASGSAVSLTSGTAKDLTTLTLGAGDWDVTLTMQFTGGATTTVNNLISSISSTLNTLDQTAGRYIGIPFNALTVFNAMPNAFAGIGSLTVRFSLAGSTTLHAIAQASFGTSTCSAYGVFRARRVR